MMPLQLLSAESYSSVPSTCALKPTRRHRRRLQPPHTSLHSGVRFQGGNGKHRASFLFNCFDHRQIPFISKSLLSFSMCTERLDKKQTSSIVYARKRGDLLVAACESRDGMGYVSSPDSLGANNGHFSSSAGDANGLPVQSGNGNVGLNSTEPEKRVHSIESDREGGDALDKTADIENALSVENLRENFQSAVEELECARLNSSKLEEDAQGSVERAFALRDKAADAETKAEKAQAMVDKVSDEEMGVKELLSKGRFLLADAEAQVIQAEKALIEAQQRLYDQQAVSFGNERKEVGEDTSIQDTVLSVPHGTSVTAENANEAENFKAMSKGETMLKGEGEALLKEEQDLIAAQAEVESQVLALAQYEKDLSRIKSLKRELEEEALRMTAAAKLAKDLALAAEEEVAQVMSLAEQAVALEVDSAQKVCIAEMAYQKAEKMALDAMVSTQAVDLGGVAMDDSDKGIMSLSTLEVSPEGLGFDKAVIRDITDSRDNSNILAPKVGGLDLEQKLMASTSLEAAEGTGDIGKKDVNILLEIEVEKPKVAPSSKENAKEAPSSGVPKSFTKRSSRFFPASFFSSNDDDEEFTLTTVFRGMKENFVKVAVSVLLLCGMSMCLKNRMINQVQLTERTEYVSGFEEVTTSAKPLMRELRKLPKKVQRVLEQIPQQEINEEEASLFDVLWLLLASVIFVPIFQKLPGGSPVLGYLAAGVLLGPYSLSIIRNVHGSKAIAEFGVVFLLFNIGLELSVERLSSMKKYVFGLGTSQVLVTAFVVGLVSHYLFGFSGPAALVVGNGLALSSTAVVLQVLQERGESTSRHGRATFSVLLFQDLAVVVLLILVPLLSPTSSKGGVGFQAIAEALGVAALKGVIAIMVIIAGGRLLLRPIYKRMAENHNAEIFAANTLFVVLGTSVLTARAGLSMALGAFLAGLLLAETEFALQVESDIAPYRGLLLGLFFMTVGMAIDPKLFISKFPIILSALSLLLVGKTALVTLVGRLFGLSTVAAVRAGLLLAPGGEFAFVAFGEAVNQQIMTSNMSSLLYLVVGLSMALTPWLGALGQIIATQFEQQDVRNLLPAETETDDLQDHIIICGFGRVGQIIAQLLSERLIPFVALDVRSERVSAGRAVDLPVYFGDAGSKEVLHKVGAERASAAVIALDTPGANYRAVWALSKHFPNVKTFVRAHDVDHGISLEKAGATAVVPETLEPSLQLAAAVLTEAKLPASEIAATIDEFRSTHLSELTELCETSGSCLGYGFSRIMSKPKSHIESSVKGKADDDVAGEPWQEALAAP